MNCVTLILIESICILKYSKVTSCNMNVTHTKIVISDIHCRCIFLRKIRRTAWVRVRCTRFINTLRNKTQNMHVTLIISVGKKRKKKQQTSLYIVHNYTKRVFNLLPLYFLCSIYISSWIFIDRFFCVLIQLYFLLLENLMNLNHIYKII